MNQFKITESSILGLKLIERQFLNDSRGFFSRIFCHKALDNAGWKQPVAQINHSFTSKRGTLRGLHYQQNPHSEMKLVTCIQGEIFDVAVDLRVGSPTFLNWYSEILSAHNGRSLLIPEGFAHGFQTLSDDVALVYCHSKAYITESEAALNARDPALAISWPIEISLQSSRDTKHRFIDKNFIGVSL